MVQKFAVGKVIGTAKRLEQSFFNAERRAQPGCRIAQQPAMGTFLFGEYKRKKIGLVAMPFAKACDMLRVNAAGNKRKAGIKRPR